MTIPDQRTTSDASRQRSITRDLAFVRERWGDLLAARIPGTPRPWAETRMSADDMAEISARDAAERAERRPEAIGEHAAPLRIDVLDAIRSVSLLALELEDDLRDRLGFGPAHRPMPAEGEPPGWAHWALVWVHDAMPSLTTDMLSDVARAAAHMAATVRTALREIEPGSPIKAPCLGCGQMTLRLFVAPQIAGSYVLCLNDTCRPAEALCGSWLRGHPMWPCHELEWLADQLDTRAATPA